MAKTRAPPGVSAWRGLGNPPAKERNSQRAPLSQLIGAVGVSWDVVAATNRSPRSTNRWDRDADALTSAWGDRVSPDIRRALELLAASVRQGRSTDVLAYDVGPEVLAAIVRAGLASEHVEHLAVPGARPADDPRKQQ